MIEVLKDHGVILNHTGVKNRTVVHIIVMPPPTGQALTVRVVHVLPRYLERRWHDFAVARGMSRRLGCLVCGLNFLI